ncbi:MAG: hypothetical protein KatS3mg011_0421 [Acidimicrobiia bacterium]|nr:MAG: hypothetical protein KatS3mg011_0421 [Acidimicrobiia bacterium]
MRRRRSDRWTAAFLVAAAVLLLPLPARAERTQSDLVLIREGDRVDEDLYAAGNVIRVAGVVAGDLVAAAAHEVRIDGTVEGDLEVIATSLVVAGEVGGSVRAIARTVRVSGEVAGDVWVAAGRVEHTGSIGGDLYLWAVSADVAGEVGRDLGGWSRRAVLRSEVGRDVDLTVDRLEVAVGTTVGGDLVYTSSREAEVSPDATVAGTLVRRRPLPPNVRVRALGLLTRILWGLGMILLALAMLWAAPRATLSASRAVGLRPLRSIVWGIGSGLAVLAVLVGGVVALSLAPPEAAVPLLLIALPVGILFLALVTVGLLVGPVPVAGAVGGRLLPERSPYAQSTVGMLVLVTVALVPVVGPFWILVVGLVGVGGWFASGGDQAATEDTPP